MNKIIWISSYPKSGNTWVRYFLANYFFNKEKKFDYNILKFIKKFPDDFVELEQICSAKEINENPFNISKYWLKTQELIKIQSGNVIFLKNHNALVSINKNDFTNEILSLASIYIVRDPRDIVVSYANFKNISYDKAIDQICSDKLLYFKEEKKNNFPKVEIVGSWKFNYTSWRDGVKNMPKLIIKYEDLIEKPKKNFRIILNFLSRILKINISEEMLELSLQYSDFQLLQSYEKKYGFNENNSQNLFFRNGKIESWRNELNKSQISKIENYCSNEMQYLHYI